MTRRQLLAFAGLAPLAPKVVMAAPASTLADSVSWVECYRRSDSGSHFWLTSVKVAGRETLTDPIRCDGHVSFAVFTYRDQWGDVYRSAPQPTRK